MSFETVRRWAVPALFVVAAALGAIRLASPFTHYHENVTACYLNWMRNYARHGYAVSGGAPVRSVDPVRPAGPVPRGEIYSRRPPTVSLLSSAVTGLFGPTEAAMRLVGLGATLGLLGVFLPVARRLLGPDDGLLATALLAFTPIVPFFGIVAAHQTFGVLGGLGVILAYLRWRERPSKGRLWALAGAALAASWLDWPGFYGAGGVCVLHLATSRERRLVSLVAPAAAVVGFGLFLLYLLALDPSDGVPLRNLLSTGDAHRRGVPLGGYLGGLANAGLRGFTAPLLVLALLGATRLRPRTFEDAAILVTAVLGADVFVFPNLTNGHWFMILPWAPVLALAAARGLRFLLDRGRFPRVLAAAAGAGFLALSAHYLARAHGGGPFPYYAETSRALGLALARHVAPEETALVRGYVDPHVVPYYADRRVALWSPRAGALEQLYRMDRTNGADEAWLIERLSRPGHGYSWFVTTSLGTAGDRLPALQAVRRDHPDPDAFVRTEYELESDTQPSAIAAFLRQRVPVTERDGFLFFDLRGMR